MGQSKRRGTFEERKVSAITRKKEQKSINVVVPVKAPPSTESSLDMVMGVASHVGITQYYNYINIGTPPPVILTPHHFKYHK